MRKKAVITGIAGQDGSYLAELLLARGYDVHGFVRRTSQLHRERIDAARQLVDHHAGHLHLHYGNLLDPLGLVRLLRDIAPDEVYNLASESHVGISFAEPEHSVLVNGLGALRLLEILRQTLPTARFYQASTSELYGGHDSLRSSTATVPAVFDEESTFAPASPYAAAKQYAHTMTKLYRLAYGLHASNGILFNHESPRRGVNFVSRKITVALAMLRRGQNEPLRLGNLDSRRDWGYAPDYVRAMWLMTVAPEPDDFVIASGETHSVREFVERAADVAGFRLEWSGEGPNELGTDRLTGRTLVTVDQRFFRPTDHSHACGSPAKARQRLGWAPSVSFEQLVELMMTADLADPTVAEAEK